MKMIKIPLLFFVLLPADSVAMQDIVANSCFGYALKQISAWWQARKQLERTIELLKITSQDPEDFTKVVELVRAGALLQGADAAGWTPLHKAARQGHAQTAKYLISKAPLIHSKTADGSTPLHVAALHNSLEVLKLLLKHDALINIRNDDGQTPLHSAAQKGHFSIMLCLICQSFFPPSWQDAKATELLAQVKSSRLENMRTLLTELKELNDTSRSDPSKENDSLDMKLIKIIGMLNTKLSNHWSTDIIADLIDLEHQKNMITRCKQADAHKGANFENILIAAHGKRHLHYLQQVLAIQDRLGKTARDVATVGNHSFAAIANPPQLLTDIKDAQKMSALPKSMQDGIMHSMRLRLAGKTDSQYLIDQKKVLSLTS